MMQPKYWTFQNWYRGKYWHSWWSSEHDFFRKSDWYDLWGSFTSHCLLSLKIWILCIEKTKQETKNYDVVLKTTPRDDETHWRLFLFKVFGLHFKQMMEMIGQNLLIFCSFGLMSKESRRILFSTTRFFCTIWTNKRKFGKQH